VVEGNSLETRRRGNPFVSSNLTASAIFYIDVPNFYPYDFTVASSSSESLQMHTGAKRIRFICNSLGKLSKGDLYQVELDKDDDVISFVLRTGFKPVQDEERINQYLQNR
jgi:hypothetical protein